MSDRELGGRLAKQTARYIRLVSSGNNANKAAAAY